MLGKKERPRFQKKNAMVSEPVAILRRLRIFGQRDKLKADRSKGA
jgi:hypothetical protein